MSDSLLERNVPIVGAPCAVFEAEVVVPVRCHCHDDNLPFLITSIHQAKICARCGMSYVVNEVEFDRRKGHPFVKVAVSPLRLAQPREN